MTSMSTRRQRYTIELPDLVFEFDGVRVAGPVSTRDDDGPGRKARWFEMTLYRTDGGVYMLHRVSLSEVPGEQPRVSLSRTPDAGKMIELLSAAKRKDGTISDQQSRPMAELLRQAAKSDPAFRGPKPIVRIA